MATLYLVVPKMPRCMEAVISSWWTPSFPVSSAQSRRLLSAGIDTPVLFSQQPFSVLRGLGLPILHKCSSSAPFHPLQPHHGQKGRGMGLTWSITLRVFFEVGDEGVELLFALLTVFETAALEVGIVAFEEFFFCGGDVVD
jgi:hypothetical protein